MRKILSEKTFKYIRCFRKNMTDEQVAAKLGYKTTETGRKAGYKQIENLKNNSKQKQKKFSKQRIFFMEKIELSEEQKEFIDQNYKKISNLNELTCTVFMGEDLDGRQKKGELFGPIWHKKIINTIRPESKSPTS